MLLFQLQVTDGFVSYVGTLHEINSENATVALENVTSHGTENRQTGDKAVQPSARLYEYIVFRGSDVKDLRIEEPPKENSPAPTQMPDDPAILGSTRPPQQSAPQPPTHTTPQPQAFAPPPPYNQFHPPYPPMPNPGFGRGGFPGGPQFPGYPGMPYGGPGPQNWYPQGQGFQGPPNAFPPQPPVPIAPPSQQQNAVKQQQQPPQPAPVKEQKKPEKQFPKAPEPAPPAPKVHLPQTQPAAALAAAIAGPSAAKKAPTPPVESKPDVAAALAPPATVQAKLAPTAPKGRVMPAIPLPSPNFRKSVPAPVPQQPAPATQASQAKAVAAQNEAVAAASSSLADASSSQQAAIAAVDNAMAKLRAQQQQQQAQPAQTPIGGGGDAFEHLTRKINEMRTDESIRHPRQPGTGGFAGGARGRGPRRGGRDQPPPAKPELPATDFDFESMNAKFSKASLNREANGAGGTPPAGVASPNGSGFAGQAESADVDDEVVIPPAAPAYNKKSSFFDNLSSELRDREDHHAVHRGRGGAEFRSEERKKNMETFGQGSVDNYRGGYRGRGRGRGGYRGRGGQYGGYGQQGARGGNVGASGTGGGYRPRGGLNGQAQGL
ncbi:hypothetical protein EJ06DRAFT_126472 [Trichodelitschia bisporula]|uniref:TFG box profile domain-containing protein n=1 Tax=Trichodelitschia bisporula TaxID=703511 RepID=A0A6G1HQI9_9PEZI|nr:hypothetical protein EJ06DRAFT_126472 [Trichodelitschia bisporula]